jgi:predicted ATPase/class 3 adenylate cyclase
MPSPGARPTGTVTFLFTDIEGSTRLVERFGPDWPDLLERHRAKLRAAFSEHRGWEQGTEGDSFFVAFASARDAVAAAVDAQRGLAAERWPPGGEIRVRMGLHTGEGRLSGSDYVGIDVHRAARIAAVAHGGQVLASEATATIAGADLPTGVSFREMGEHRLKDLPRPERLSQLVIDGLPSEFPPIRSLGGDSTVPAALTSFVGRDRERIEVRRLIAESRLVTITGVGGTGKTRLAIEVARDEAPALPGGATFVPLEAIRDPDLIPVEILRSLHLDDASPTAPTERVIEHFRDLEALLVLDNLEQLPTAGLVVAQLIAGAPLLRILVASQAALRIRGEREYRLEPFGAPTADEPTGGAMQPIAELERHPAIRLFVDRARAVRPSFELDAAIAPVVVELCRRLDGLPLAIELAAAQVRILSPAAILGRLAERLDTLPSTELDTPERHRTLHAAVRWSYDLLEPRQQMLLRLLSAFRGSAALEDIEALRTVTASRSPLGPDTLGDLADLVDRSLVRTQNDGAVEPRFRVLETVRAVSREILAAEGEEAATLDAHADRFAALAATAEPELYGRDRRRWLDRLADDHDNLRAALDRLEATGRLEAALALAADLWRFWQLRGHIPEGRARVLRLLEAAEAAAEAVPAAILSRAEEAAGSLAYWQRIGAGPGQVEPHYRRSLELARASGDEDREAWALYNLAFLYDFVPGLRDAEADLQVASELRDQALALFRRVGDRRGIAESLWALGGSPVALADPELARARLVEAVALLESLGDGHGASWAVMSLGLVEALEGRLAEAQARVAKAARTFVEDGDLAGQVVAVQAVASFAARASDPGTAARLAAAAEARSARIGVDLPGIPPILEPLAAAAVALDPAEREAHQRAGRGLDFEAVLAGITEGRSGAALAGTDRR